MKTLLCLFLSMICLFATAQIKKMDEKKAIKESHIDFSKEHLYFTIHGLIQRDNAIFMNDTCKCPIIYIANIEKVTIIDTCSKIKYKFDGWIQYKKDKIMKLTKEETIEFNPSWPKQQFFISPTNTGSPTNSNSTTLERHDN